MKGLLAKQFVRVDVGGQVQDFLGGTVITDDVLVSQLAAHPSFEQVDDTQKTLKSIEDLRAMCAELGFVMVQDGARRVPALNRDASA